MTSSDLKAAPAAASRPGAGRRKLAIFTGLCAMLLAAALLSICIGTRSVGWGEIASALAGRVESIGEASVAVRIPRTFLAVFAGAALGVAGAIMQGMTRNPLADPGLLGVNTGAALAVVIGVAWFNMASAQAYIWAAILGAAATSAFVFTIGSLGRGGPTPLKLSLAGAATSIAFASLVLAIVLPRNDIAGGIRSWQIGGVGGATFERMYPVLPFLALGFLVSLVTARKLNSLALGDELATGLGERVRTARALAALAAILLSGATTAICGPIGFIGLVVPHACRLIVGVDHRWLLPFSAVSGAILLTVADIAGRIVARPGEIDVGIVTAFIGAPIFIWIVRRQKVRDL